MIDVEQLYLFFEAFWTGALTMAGVILLLVAVAFVVIHFLRHFRFL